MLYKKFISLIRDHAEQLTRDWIKEVKNNPATPGYKNIPEDILHKRAYEDYVKLGELLLEEEPTFQSQAEHYMKLGRDRASEGLKLSEIIYALILSSVVLWNYVVGQGLINSAIDLQQALGFYQKMSNFYDKAAYFVACGYEQCKNRGTTPEKTEDFVEKTVKSVTKWFIHEIK